MFIKPETFFKAIGCLWLCLVTSYSSYGQDSKEKYFIGFKEKTGLNFDPFDYFDPLAIQRRFIAGIPFDSLDWPVDDQNLELLKTIQMEPLVVSRWMNGVFCWANCEQIAMLKGYPEIKIIESVQPAFANLCALSLPDSLPSPLAKRQVEILGKKQFRNQKITGKGIRIAVFDAGFPEVDSHEAFQHIRNDSAIINTYDFVKKKKNVYHANVHGTAVLSCIGGICYGDEIGLATESTFLLARTERGKLEPFSEEENWLAAAEWADKNGAHIINSSLGYTYHRYFPQEMNGKESFVAKAARIAVRKGILVVNAAGNDGSNAWKIVNTPADVDSVLSIGGIDPYLGTHISFSSYGPTADGKRKPNVIAPGKVQAASTSGFKNMYGTSFASPLMAGFAACAWQTNPKYSNMELFTDIEKSAHLYPYYDYAHGYGIPSASYFCNKEKWDKVKNNETFDLIKGQNELLITIKEEWIPKVTENLEEAIKKAQTSWDEYMYISVTNHKGIITKYWLLQIYKKDAFIINNLLSYKDQSLNVYYKNCYKRIDL